MHVYPSKLAGFFWRTSRNRIKPPAYYYVFEGYDLLNHQQSNQINVSSVPLLFTLGVDCNVAFFTLIFTSL
jgi:hypothetical protein